jgi:O-antigen/teichoic acid export membrane protein
MIIYLVGGVVAAGGNILLAPVYLRLLSVDEYGAWSLFSLMLQFLQPIMSWGLLATMARLMVESDFESRTRIPAAALKMVTVLNCGLLAIIWGVNQSSLFTPQIGSKFQILLPLAALAAALSAYPNILMGLYIADSKALLYRSLGLIGFALQAAALGACAYNYTMTDITAIYSMLAAASLYAAWSLYKLAQGVNWHVGVQEYKALLAFGGPVVLYTVAGQSFDFFTRYLLAAKISANDFGAFSAGIIYSSGVAMLSSAVNLAWVPLFFRHANEWSTSGVYRHFVNVFTTVIAICAGCLIIFSNEFLELYSGGKVSLDIAIVGALVIAAWLNSAIWMCFVNPLFHQKRTKLVLIIVIVAISFTMPVGFFLIDSHGVFGGSISLLINAFILCLVAAIVLRKYKGPKLDYTKLSIVFLSLILLSSPVLKFPFHELLGIPQILGNFIVFAVFTVAMLLLIRRSVGLVFLEIKLDAKL